MLHLPQLRCPCLCCSFLFMVLSHGRLQIKGRRVGGGIPSHCFLFTTCVQPASWSSLLKDGSYIHPNFCFSMVCFLVQQNVLELLGALSALSWKNTSQQSSLFIVGPPASHFTSLSLGCLMCGRGRQCPMQYITVQIKRELHDKCWYPLVLNNYLLDDEAVNGDLQLNGMELLCMFTFFFLPLTILKWK